MPLGEQAAFTKIDNSYDAYCQARSNYHEALQAYDDVPKKTESFNKAIQAINLATAKNAENPSYWLLGSQIYRSRGGVGFAKNYFAKACNLYEQKLQQAPFSLTYNLQYAIACYAGDAQFYADYNAYKSKAVKSAKVAAKAIEELESIITDKDFAKEIENDPESKTVQELVEAELFEQKFLACVVLHDDKNLAKLRVRINKQYTEQTSLQSMLADYENLVLNGKWYWKVSDKEAAEKAFLLYYLRDWAN